MSQWKFWEKKVNPFSNKRFKTQEIENDKAFAELAYYFHKYEDLESRFSMKSKLTRRIAKWSLPIVVLALGSLLFEKYFNIVIPSSLSMLKCLKPFLPLIAVAGITVFTWAFFSNRISGYTRGWSRNRLMREHLERMIREYQLALCDKDITKVSDQKFIQSEQENILAKLFQLEETNRIQTHNDIVGDYFSAHDGAINWIKELKK
ncbi:hypothetical protein ACRN93_02915 [Shewanella baltica]|uniref:hypothetical protein n=1 Tax=Shewanella baltica TaxID=62322 RepID=UPI0030526C8F